jgi:hypothetical protein
MPIEHVQLNTTDPWTEVDDDGEPASRHDPTLMIAGAMRSAYRDLSKNGSLGGERRGPTTSDGGIWDMKKQRADDRGHYT